MMNLATPAAPATTATASTTTSDAAVEPDHEFLACLEAHVARLGAELAGDDADQMELALDDTSAEDDTEPAGDHPTHLLTAMAAMLGAETTPTVVAGSTSVASPMLDGGDARPTTPEMPAAPVEETVATASTVGTNTVDTGRATPLVAATGTDAPATTAAAGGTRPATSGTSATTATSATDVPDVAATPTPADADPDSVPSTRPADGDGPVTTVRPTVDARPAATVVPVAPAPTAAPSVDAAAPVEAAGDPTPSAPVEDPWEQLANVVRPLRTAPDGTQRLSLQLRPAELGTVHLEVSLDDGVLSVRAVAETAATRELLAASFPELRAELTRSGLSLGTVDVGPDTSGGDSAAHGDGDRPATPAASDPTGSGNAPTPTTSTPPSTSAAPGRLDLVI
ncbi:MAG: flagellar hook-length control protein FliK [Acidimicrobiales bacterium]